MSSAAAFLVRSDDIEAHRLITVESEGLSLLAKKEHDSKHKVTTNDRTYQLIVSVEDKSSVNPEVDPDPWHLELNIC